MISSKKDVFDKELRQLKFNRVKEVECRIVSLSPQGDKLFVIARRLDNGKLVGNEAGIEEKSLMMAEVLIPTDYDISSSLPKLEHLVGRRCVAIYSAGNPKQIIVKEKSVDSRKIRRMDIVKARSLSPNKDIRSKEAIKFLEDLGYKNEDIEDIINETYRTDFDGYVLSYGSTSVWHKGSYSDSRAELDISTFISSENVDSLPKSSLKDRDCHKPVIAITGK